MFSIVAFLSASVIEPLAIIRSKLLMMVFIPRSMALSEISIKQTLKPFCAKVCAIPLPIVPAPITAIFFIFLFYIYYANILFLIYLLKQSMILCAMRNASVPSSKVTIGVVLLLMASAKVSNSSKMALLLSTLGLSK